MCILKNKHIFNVCRIILHGRRMRLPRIRLIRKYRIRIRICICIVYLLVRVCQMTYLQFVHVGKKRVACLHVQHEWMRTRLDIICNRDYTVAFVVFFMPLWFTRAGRIQSLIVKGVFCVLRYNIRFIGIRYRFLYRLIVFTFLNENLILFHYYQIFRNA